MNSAVSLKRLRGDLLYYYSAKTNEKWMQALEWYIIRTFTRRYNKKYQRRNHMLKVEVVRNIIYGKELRKWLEYDVML